MTNDLSIGQQPLRSTSLLATRDAETDAARDAAARGRDTEASVAFEKLFATLMVRELRRALPEGPFGGGAGADVYESWFDQHLGETLAERDALGLAGLVRTSIQRTQAASDQAAAEGESR